MHQNKAPQRTDMELTEAVIIKETFKNYRNGVRVMFLIHRNKEGGNTNNTKLEKLISTNEVEWQENLVNLLEKKNNSSLELRIYQSANARDIHRAIRTFKEQQLANDYNNDVPAFYYDIRNRFISALMKPSNRIGTRFLIDIDDEREKQVAEIELGRANIQIFNTFKTKNGWHYVTEPYNPALTPITASKINKDGLLLLDW